MNGRSIGKKLFFAGLCAALAWFSACASTVHRDGFDTGRFSLRPYSAENINGRLSPLSRFPEAVYIKTRTQSFNTYHWYLLSDGRIWYKSIDPEREPKEWMLFEKTGLPHNAEKPGFRRTDAIVEISADADELAALSVEGAFYRYCFDSTIAHASNVWLDRQGWPVEEQLYLDGRVAENIAWAIGKRNLQVLYYEDTFGNRHHNGTQEIVTTCMLLADGQEIAYADTGLPSDFSRNFAGPERGTFRALSLSASASTMFVINDAGEMYTRMADFDITGSDPMFFKYTYIPHESDLEGSDFFSNYSEWALPPEDWRKQPAIPLAGNAAISRRITILQNGQGNAARELRVAGRNAAGDPGYWKKAIFADTWEFQTAPLVLGGEDFLPVSGNDAVRGGRGNSADKGYRGYWWSDGEKENDFEYEIPDFNILEGSCGFRINYRDETCVLKLHPVEMWTFLKRDCVPGRDGPPKLFFVTLEIPENAFAGLSEDFVRRVSEKFGKNNRVLFKYTMAASSRFVIMRETGGANMMPEQGPALFLTDGSISDYFPGFRRTWYAAQHDIPRRYRLPELTLDGDAVTPGEVEEKIAANRVFLAELQRRIAGLRRDKIAAILMDMVYLPLHYTVRFSPLRFVDAPKIRTMTSYGEKIVLANSAHTAAVSGTGIWILQKTMRLIEARIKCYEELAERLSGGAETAAMPAHCPETVTEYWDIAGLPRRVTGYFSGPGGNIPATLRFHDGEENGELFGWYLSAENDGGFTFFIDPKNSLETVRSRRGKTPEERRVKLYCTLYVNPGRTGAAERRIIESSIRQFSRIDQGGIDVALTYDGSIFEIRESPARHGSTLIFRGGPFQ